MVAPTRLCEICGRYLYPNTSINQNLKTGGYGIRPYETTEILLTPLSFRPKKNGPQKRSGHRRRSLPPANTGRAPSGMGGPCSHSPHWATKNLFPKRFLRSFFLKKATLRAAAPLPAPAGAHFISKNFRFWHCLALDGTVWHSNPYYNAGVNNKRAEIRPEIVRNRLFY